MTTSPFLWMRAGPLSFKGASARSAPRSQPWKPCIGSNEAYLITSAPMRMYPPDFLNVVPPGVNTGARLSTRIVVEDASLSEASVAEAIRFAIRSGEAPLGFTSPLQSVTFHDQIEPRGSEYDGVGPPSRAASAAIASR